MKKLFVYILAAVIAVGTVSCKKEEKYRIGVSQCSSDDWRNKMNEEIRREIMFHPDAEVEIRSANDNNSRQISDIRYFIDNDFDIIIAAPNEEEAITPIIKEAYDKGIPVIIFDRSIRGGDYYTAFQGADNELIGEAAAKYARSIAGDNARVLEIRGLDKSTPAAGRHNGFAHVADSLGIERVASAEGNWNYDEAFRAADSMLGIYTDIDVIYAHNDRMAMAAADAAAKQKREIKIIGVDAAPEIGLKAVLDGKIDASFIYPTNGDMLVKTALAILKGEPYQKEAILPLVSPVDESNADILMLQNESLKEESDKIRKLKIEVDNYWNRHTIQTALFYSVVAILVLLFGFLFMLLRSYWQHRRHQTELLEQNRLLEQQRDTEKTLNNQLNEATQSKLAFFTNVSHDLRTPLTLIAEPVEQLAEADYLTPQHKALMQIADKNVKILKRLINQILDFRKYENGRLELRLSNVKIGEALKEWMAGFEAIARRRHMKLTSDIELPDGFQLALDIEKIERVFFNILSNAFKYTPDNGSIHVSSACRDGIWTFSVEDTGKGIASTDIANIFDRFFQVDKIRPKGSGIGLSLAKAFVELHEGRIDVKSEPGEGTKFTVSIPVRNVGGALADIDEERAIPDSEISAELCVIDAPDHGEDDSRPLLLVIDDNDDIRAMIRELMCGDYRIIGARDGRDGLRMATKYVPDLIICDVMMPVIDGMECCRIIKEEVSTSHIPVLMLTACSLDEQRLQGYESGADGYLAKPFNQKVLKSRCDNLIENRKRIRKLWLTKETGTPEGGNRPLPARGDIDSEFYTRFLEVVREEMGNPDLNVDSLASKLGLGRSQFYRKIKALTNFSPVELLRKMRIEKARELLTATEKSISEIAYEVGFSAPAYFTRVYRETYGETPTDLRERLGHK